MRESNAVLAGVGGQGILFAAEVLGVAAVSEGLDVRVSEIHGMAQRGGAVVSHVRMGSNVLSPTIMEGKADLLLGFEPLETLRNLKYTSEKTLVIMSDERIPPTELAAKGKPYPDMAEIVQQIHVFTKRLATVETRKLAQEAGSSLTQNTVMIGALAAFDELPITKETFLSALRELVPPKHVGTNTKAFELGYDYIAKKRS